jgi:hypothetical protein
MQISWARPMKYDSRACLPVAGERDSSPSSGGAQLTRCRVVSFSLHLNTAAGEVTAAVAAAPHAHTLADSIEFINVDARALPLAQGRSRQPESAVGDLHSRRRAAPLARSHTHTPQCCTQILDLGQNI